MTRAKGVGDGMSIDRICEMRTHIVDIRARARVSKHMDAKNEIRVGVRELRNDLTRYLKAARDGATVIVTSRNAVIAELRAPSSERLPPRRPGGLEGKIWMAEDFDTWPEDILQSFEAWKY